MAQRETIAAPEVDDTRQETIPTPARLPVEVAVAPERISAILTSACSGWVMLRVDMAGPPLSVANPDAPLFQWVHARLEDVAPLLWRDE